MVGPYDTGSQVSFINHSLGKQQAAELLSQARPCPFQVHGDTIPMQGIISMECCIGDRGWCKTPVCEPILLGLDFIIAHKARWDWKTSVIKLQNALESAAYPCLLSEV